MRVRDREAADEVVQRVFLRLATRARRGQVLPRALPRRRLERRELDRARLRVDGEGGRDAARRLGRRRAGRVRGVGGRARPRRLDRRPPRPRARGARPAPPRGALARRRWRSGSGSSATPSTRRPTEVIGRWRRSSVLHKAVDELFADYAAALARGERPRAARLPGQAPGPEADELATMIERFLQAAPRAGRDRGGVGAARWLAPARAAAARAPPSGRG